MTKALFGKTLTELKKITEDLLMPGYAAKQIAGWLYRQNITSIEMMTSLSKANREKLASQYSIGLSEPATNQVSADGTVKYLFCYSGSRCVEAVYIPEHDRHTLCLSSQAGCRMGCTFCLTGIHGFQSQLETGEILNQYRSLPQREKITNIVFMGMGEPLDNLDAVLNSIEILTSEYGYGLSNRRITVSTIGVIRSLKRFLLESPCHLAVSLHSPFSEERKLLVPAEKAFPIREIIALIKSLPEAKQKRVSFEYIVFKEMNHSNRHVNELARLLNGLKCHINLIGFHPVPEFPYRSPELPIMEEFQNALKKKGIPTTIRKSRGVDISAACGLLSTSRTEIRNTII